MALGKLDFARKHLLSRLDLCPARKARPDVLLGAFGWKPHGAGTTANEEISFCTSFDPFPFQKDRFRAPLAAYNADRFILYDLRFRVDAGARPIPQAIANDLGKMAHEFVIVFELVELNSDN